MRLGDFIEANLEPILVEFEAFARSIWPDSASVALSEPTRSPWSMSGRSRS